MSRDPFNLEGRIALVTGASRGIGEAIARRLASSGAQVVVSSRYLEGCQAVVDAIIADGGAAEALACHVGDMDDIERCFDTLRQRHGRLDILVNNAAANPYFGPILDTPPDAFQKTFEVNVRGYFYMSVAAGKLMRENGGGAIVNTASINALQPGIGLGIYSISKAAVVNMTRAFAKECAADGIRVNALLPGLTRTRFAGALFEDEDLYRRMMSQIPLRHHAEPDDMSGAVLYLVSDAARYTTGECIVVDGGMTL